MNDHKHIWVRREVLRGPVRPIDTAGPGRARPHGQPDPVYAHVCTTCGTVGYATR